jgi:hypothetical protein
VFPRQATALGINILKRPRNISPFSFELQSKRVFRVFNKTTKENHYVNEYQ